MINCTIRKVYFVSKVYNTLTFLTGQGWIVWLVNPVGSLLIAFITTHRFFRRRCFHFFFQSETLSLGCWVRAPHCSPHPVITILSQTQHWPHQRQQYLGSGSKTQNILRLDIGQQHHCHRLWTLLRRWENSRESLSSQEPMLNTTRVLKQTRFSCIYPFMPRPLMTCLQHSGYH